MKSTPNQKLISHGKNGFIEVSKNLAMMNNAAKLDSSNQLEHPT